MAGIFISYRHDDTQGWVGRLARALQESFPQAEVFYDIATLQPGEDFPRAIERALLSCQVVLVLIGPRWLRSFQGFPSCPPPTTAGRCTTASVGIFS